MHIKTIYILGVLMAAISFVGCGNDNIDNFDHNEDWDEIVKKDSKNWISENNDTIYFQNGLMTFRGAKDFYMVYLYKIENDFLYLWTSTSNEANDWKGYPIELGSEYFILYNFNEIDKATYKKQK